MEEYTVSNMQELFDAVSEIKVTHPVIWFRGLSKISYKLEPSIYRSPYNAKKHEAQLLGRFKSLSPSYLKSIPQMIQIKRHGLLVPHGSVISIS